MPPREGETGWCQGGEAQGERTGASDGVGPGARARGDETLLTTAGPGTGFTTECLKLVRALADAVVAAFAAGDTESARMALGRLASILKVT